MKKGINKSSTASYIKTLSVSRTIIILKLICVYFKFYKSLIKNAAHI